MRSIIKFFKNVIACFALHCFIFNHRVDEDLDDLFWALSWTELSNVKIGTHTVSFDAIGLHFEEIWNRNKWYGWLKRGRVLKEGEIVFRWDDARPSAYIMWVFLRQHSGFISGKPGRKIKGLLYEQAVEKCDV